MLVADADHGDGKRFIVQADEKLTTFLELERATHESSRFPNAGCESVVNRFALDPRRQRVEAARLES